MKIYLSILLTLLTCISNARTIHIAVIDSGYYTDMANFNKCQDVKEQDFTNSNMGLKASHGHNVTHIIAGHLKGTDYCIVPIKIFNGGINEAIIYHFALLYALEAKVDIVNLSLVGILEDPMEDHLIREMLDNGIKVVAAAGNKDTDLDKSCSFYPACIDPRIISVGALNSKGKKEEQSNYGKVIKAWQLGENVMGGGIIMTGTSQSTAIQTAIEARKLMNKK